MKNLETRLQNLEKSRPGINSLSELSYEELKAEGNKIKAKLKTLLESGDYTGDEVVEIKRVLERLNNYAD
ncbi:hypothetical protein METHB2_120004 [Candidatus Methylobacter favarea]|uniref:Uncharacterized protein n=1 Tax=Candidatus Methylobacter favarea TaxID=2707345 RepID=A0A8S0X700_9GAMM|nr:hypothetical protein [Candidatus Methylobacter favarea]CAA9889645.1 hypothetical protein METHB2_120004 [Candidatus Methylobacter favarea]